MASLARLTIVLAFAVFAQPAPAAAQSQQVAIHASVVDRGDAPAGILLTAADFVVREDGTPREVLEALPSPDPLSVAVLVDTSEAIEPHVSDVRVALRAFIGRVHDRHEIAIFTFGDRPTLLVDYTRDPKRLDEAIGRIHGRPGTGAYLLDAIVEVSNGLRAREAARSAIVVISSEGPEFSARYHRSVVEALRHPSITLHSFVLTRHRRPSVADAAREREIAIAKGTELTGGRSESLLTSSSLPLRLASLAVELKSAYRIVYSRPASLLGPESVKVIVGRDDLVVRASRVAQARAAAE